MIEKKHEVKKKYLRAKEVANYLSIGISTVWYWSKHGQLTPIKLSARVTVFSIDEVDKFVNADIA